jgi:hypothetical protein
MGGSGGGIRFLAAAVLSAILVSGWANASVFKYSADEAWSVEETMFMRARDPVSGKGPLQVSRIITNYTVMRLFPDGSALVRKECGRSYMGSSERDLKEIVVPEAPPVGYLLMTGKGEIYLAQAKPVFATPEEQEMAEGFDFPDEVGMLESAATTEEFLATGRTPMDAYKLAPGNVPLGKGVGVSGFWVSRTKDEKLDVSLCEVHIAKRGVVTETVWFDRRAGRVLQRRIIQGDPASVEILQVRR